MRNSLRSRAGLHSVSVWSSSFFYPSQNRARPFSRKKVLLRRALRLGQNADHPLFLLSLTGDEFVALAELSRISRDDAGKL